LRKYYPNEPKLRAKIDTALDWKTTLYNIISPIAYPKLKFSEFDKDKDTAARKTLNDLIWCVFINYFLNGNKFIGNDEPCIADFSIVAYFKMLDVTDVEVPNEVKEYVTRMDEGSQTQSYIQHFKISNNRKICNTRFIISYKFISIQEIVYKYTPYQIV
jgi:glutathione S-transferase